jgi:hypothetical protein
MRVALLFVLAGLAACVSQAPPPAIAPSPVAAPAPPPNGLLVAPAPQGPSVGYTPAARTKETGCQANGPLPDTACTPGAVMTTDLETICHQATGPRRNVPASTHREAFTDYGYKYPQARGAFEVDHLVPLELGGDNVIANGRSRPRRRPGSTRRTASRTTSTGRCARGPCPWPTRRVRSRRTGSPCGSRSRATPPCPLPPVRATTKAGAATPYPKPSCSNWEGVVL